VLFGCFQLLPVAWASGIAGALARSIGPRLGISRRARQNLRRALPELSTERVAHIERGMWDNLGRVAAEYAHLGKFRAYEPGGRIEMVGAEIIRRCGAAGARAIFFSGHFGNWEVAPLAMTQAGSAKYSVRTLSDLSKAAPQLRLGAIPEFTTREDALPGLQRAYGGFQFKSVKLFDIGLKYKALETGQVDVVVAFGTDGQIAADHLVVLIDDKHFWPAYQVAPVVRRAALERHPEIATYLNKLAPLLTDAVMRDLNYKVDGGKQEPADVALTFLAAHQLV